MAAVPMVLALGLLLGCAAAAAGVPAVPAAAITSSASSASSSSYRLAYTTYTDAGGVVVQIAEGTLGGSGSPRITPGVVSIPGDSRGAGQLSLSPNGELLAYVVWRTGSICAANPDPEHRKGCWALETWSLEARQGQPLVALQGDAGLAGQPRVVARRCKKRHFLRHLYTKCIILPRQARDKYRENSKKEWRFSQDNPSRL